MDDITFIKQELQELKNSQLVIAQSIIEQMSDNNCNTERILNVINNNMITLYKEVSIISSNNRELRENNNKALDEQYQILLKAQQINNNLREANVPPSFQKYDQELVGIIEEKSPFVHDFIPDQQRDNNIQKRSVELERQKQADILNRLLRKRPSKVEMRDLQLLRDTYTDAKLNFERAQRRDSLSRNLRNRPLMQELVQQGILPDADNPLLAAQVNNMRMKQQSMHLDHYLQNRPDSNALFKQGIMLNSYDNFAEQKNAFSKSQMVDTLNRRLGLRPNADDLVQQNILPDANINNILLAAQINQMKYYENSKALEKSLLNRSEIDKLIDSGYLLNTSDNYQQALVQLQQAQNRDFLTRRILKNRPDISTLIHQRILPDSQNPILAAQLQKKKMQMQSNLLQDALERKINERELVEQGIIYNTGLNYDIQRSALEKSKNRDSLKRGLRNRPNIEQLVDQRVLHDAENPVIAANVYARKLRQSKEAISQSLVNRVNEQQLVQQNILMNTTTNFNDIAQQLQKEQNKDSLNKSLKMRPDVNTLVHRRVLPDSKNPVLAAQINAIKLKQQKLMLEQQLQNRTDAETLLNSGYLLNTSSNYETIAQALQRSQIEDNISRGLRNRPDVSALKDQQILPNNNVYSTLQASALALEQEMQANRLSQQLRDRQDAQTLINAGYLLNSNENWETQRRLLARSQAVDSLSKNLRNRAPPALMNLRNQTIANEVNSQNMQKYRLLLNSYRSTMDQARLDLINAQKADTVHQQLRSRPAHDELVAKGIYKTTMDQRRESLEQSLRADVINQQLKNRPTQSELNDAGIYKSPMDQKRMGLEQSLKADVVNQQLKNRPKQSELNDAGIYKSQMDQKRMGLEQSLKADVVNQQLKARPNVGELSKVGIYKSQMDQARNDLQNAQLIDNMNTKVQQKPPIEELEMKNIYKTKEEEEIIRVLNNERNDNLNNMLGVMKHDGGTGDGDGDDKYVDGGSLYVENDVSAGTNVQQQNP